MNRPSRRSLVGIVIVIVVDAAALASVAIAQDRPSPPPIEIAIRPAAEPVPALRYRLFPERQEQVPGNAALFYHRAIEWMIMQRPATSRPAQPAQAAAPRALTEDESILDWLAKPLTDLPTEAVSRVLGRHGFELREIELGARRDACDWQFLRRDEGIDLMLPEIQEARALGRLVALKARLEVKEGRIESAIAWLRTGFVLSHHLGSESITLIQSLVATAVGFQVVGVLEDLIQAPNAPNLYWALAGLPRPFLDLTTAYDWERIVLEREIPQLRDLEKGTFSAEQARSLADRIETRGAALFDKWGRCSSDLASPTLKDLAEHLRFTALVAREYPAAKRSLASSGYTASQVEAMPVIQVVALYSYRHYVARRDDMFKWVNLPFLQADQGLETAETRLTDSPGLPFLYIMPAVRSAAVSINRLDRRLGAIMTIEAIRAHAAAHAGELPPRLDALTDLPAPMNPGTGRPYDYAVNGRSATLTAPLAGRLGAIPGLLIRYELKSAR